MILRTFLAALLLLAAAHVQGQVPRTIDYQGYLTTAGGVPVNASLSISFALYEEPAGGMALWTETQTVPVNNGNYHVALGGVSPLVLPFDRPYYLGVTVGGDDEMLPRHPLSSAPYALRAGCNPGDMINCYDGAGGTLNVGACRAGVRICNAAGTAYGPCTGQVTPIAEICGNAVDDNCDGQQNDGCGSPTCSVGVPATCGTGACFRSVACTTGYETCSPGTPVAEMCNGIDDNCNGTVDVDAFPTLGQACSAYNAGTGSCQAGVYVCSSNQLGVECSAGSTPCLDAPPAQVSAQIATARASADGPADLPINGAFVTYVKPSIGSDAPGFFVQAEAPGPALFVAVAPASLSPSPVAGDKLSFTISAMGTAAALRQATAITSLVRLSQGNALAALAQEVSGAGDLISGIAGYESELIGISGSITGGFAASGTDYLAASFGTAGLAAGLQLRVPSALAASMDLAPGCTATLQRVPLWRFFATVQVSAWSAADFQSVACPAPSVVGALALSATSVRVTFDRLIDPASVSPSGAQFTLDGGLGVSAAAVSGKTVTLTTSAQTPGASYAVSVSAGVTDTYGTGVNGSANSAVFAAFATPSNLVINEVDYDQPGTDGEEFVEIFNPTGDPIALANLSLVFINGQTNTEYSRVNLSAAGAELAAGGYLVVASAGIVASVSPGAMVIQFPGATSQIQNGSPDGIVLFNTVTNTVIDALSYAGSIVAATITGAPGLYNLVEGSAATAIDSGSVPGSLSRLPNGLDTNNALADWGFTSTSTPGAPNVP